MKTRYQQMTSGCIDGYNNFIGDDTDYRDWYGIVGQHRDSDALERSNFRTILEALGGEGDNVRVERYNHWAVRWIEECYVRPGTPEYDKAVEIEKKLEDYPIFDEDDYGREEDEECQETWKNCYSDKERLEYIREHYHHFEFRDMTELMAVVRGKYYTGPSDLIY